MTQSTRTRNATERVRPPGPGGYLVAGLAIAGGTALALSRGGASTAVVLVAVLGTVAATGVMVLYRRWTLPVLLLVTVAGSGVLVRVDRALVPAWVGGVVLGLALGLELVWRRQQRRWGPSRSTAPRTAGLPGLRTVRDDGRDEVETVDPAPPEVRADVEALDGRTRTGVSVFRGTARLDIGGGAAGPVVVYHCDDTTTKKLPLWSVLTSGRGLPGEPAVDLLVAGLESHLPGDGTTDLPAALAALEVFLLTGGRAAGSPWRTGRDVDDLRGMFEGWS